jgi:nucleoside-diphosphate-sugar epimerase
MAEFSVFGARGFIGSNVARALETSGHAVRRIDRTSWPSHGAHLGHAIYAIGLTADFRTRPIETAKANVGVLADVLSDYTFSSFLYLSSARVYLGAAENGHEDARLCVDPGRNEDLYAATKLAGEALCRSIDNPAFRVARLSNVIGPGAFAGDFLPSLLAEGRQKGEIVFRTAPESCRDYVDIADVSRLLPQIAMGGRDRCYNVASGILTPHGRIAAILRARLAVTAEFQQGAPCIRYPQISIQRVRNEFEFQPISFDESIANLIARAEDWKP